MCLTQEERTREKKGKGLRDTYIFLTPVNYTKRFGHDTNKFRRKVTNSVELNNFRQRKTFRLAKTKKKKIISL